MFKTTIKDYRYLGLILCFFSLVTLANPSHASMDQVNQLRMVGQAQMNWLVFRVYLARLKTPDGRYQADRYPLALEINYLRAVKKDWLLHATDDQWRLLGVTPNNRQRWLEQLDPLWPDLRAGDQLVFYVDAQRNNQFYYNGRLIGGVNDPRFADQFLAIWLSPRTSRPDLRHQLINSSQ